MSGKRKATGRTCCPLCKGWGFTVIGKKVDGKYVYENVTCACCKGNMRVSKEEAAEWIRLYPE